MKHRFAFVRSQTSGDYRVYWEAESPAGGRSFASVVQFDTAKPGGSAPSCVRLPYSALLDLANALARAGIYPSEQAAPADTSEVAALKAHINDLRRIVFSRGDEK